MQIMEIALVILLVLAAVVAVLVLRKKKAPEATELRSSSRGGAAGRPPAAARPEAAVPAAPDPARGKAAEAAPVRPPRVEAPEEGGEASPPPPPVRSPPAPGAVLVPTAEPVSSAVEGDDYPVSTDDADAPMAPAHGVQAVVDAPLAPRPTARVESGPRPAAKSRSFLSLRKGLAKSRESTGFFGRLKELFGGKRELDPDLVERLEEVLLGSDVGMATTERMLARLKDGLSRGELSDEARVLESLRLEAERILVIEGTSGAIDTRHHPTVVLFVGVNGAGKTTTIGKLAQQLSSQGKKVMLAAGDTFRAAAVDQLKVWGRRVNCEVVTGKEGADPSSVLFDAIQAAKAARVDVLLADTAGRLHTKANLMQEMTKVQRVAAKALEGAPHETLLVIDSTNGQNALAQAREFKEALPLTGLVLTKLDGTAKGGVVLGICDALRIPVRYVGVGERAEDLHEFDPSAFVEALLGAETEVIAA